MESKQCSKHQHKELGGKLISEKNSVEGDPLHNWYKPDKASRTEAVVVAEPHHVEPKLLLTTKRWGYF